MPSANEVADFFIVKSDIESGDVMTHLKLQKLLYYAQGWHLGVHGVPLFEERIEAWLHGPVVPDVFKRFSGKKWNPILPEETVSDPESLDESGATFLEEVWEAYGEFTAKRLEEMTHDEPPWKEAFELNQPSEISQEAMRAFFSEKANE